MNTIIRRLIAVGVLTLAGCNPYDPAQRTLGGAVIGAGSGAATGAAVGGGPGAATGAAIGGTVGAVSGLVTTPPPPALYSGYYGYGGYGYQSQPLPPNVVYVQPPYYYYYRRY